MATYGVTSGPPKWTPLMGAGAARVPGDRAPLCQHRADAEGAAGSIRKMLARAADTGHSN
jgi:hypothetical protein